MSELQVLRGTWQELSVHARSLGDKQLTLVVPGDTAPPQERIPHRPEVVRTKNRLEELLLIGLASPSHEVSDEDWDKRIKRAEKRAKGELY